MLGFTKIISVYPCRISHCLPERSPPTRVILLKWYDYLPLLVVILLLKGTHATDFWYAMGASVPMLLSLSGRQYSFYIGPYFRRQVIKSLFIAGLSPRIECGRLLIAVLFSAVAWAILISFSINFQCYIQMYL